MNRCHQCGVRIRDDQSACARHLHLAQELVDEWDDDLFDSELSWSSPQNLLQLSEIFKNPTPLQTGGSSTVYRAEERQSDRAVALKLFHPGGDAQRHNFLREARVLRQLSADNHSQTKGQCNESLAPRILSWSEHKSGSYIAMQLLEFPTLAELMADNQGRLPAKQWKRIFCDLLSTVERLHKSGFVHRDLKPENIFWSESTGAVLVDFERSLSLSGQDFCCLNDKGAGTAEYMAPEQCLGEVSADPRLDVYALGSILYELAAGHPPFWGGDAAVKRLLCQQRPAALMKVAEDVSPALQRVVHRCLQKDPNLRFGSIRALKRAFEKALFSGTNSRQDESEAKAVELLRHPVPKRNPSEKNQQRLLGVLWIVGALERQYWISMIRDSDAQLLWSRDTQHIAVMEGEGYRDVVARCSALAQRLTARHPSLKVVVDITWATPHNSASGALYFDSPLWLRDDRFVDYSEKVSVQWTPVAAVWARNTGQSVSGDDTYITVSEATNLMEHGENCRGDGTLPDIQDWMRRINRGRHQWWMVTGDEGQGKSHLGRSLAQRWLSQNGVLLRLRARLPPEVMWKSALTHGIQANASTALPLESQRDAKIEQWLQMAEREECQALWPELLRHYGSHAPLLIWVDDAHCLAWKWLYALEQSLERVASKGVAVALFAESQWGLARAELGSRVAPVRIDHIEGLSCKDARKLLHSRLEPIGGFDDAVLDTVYEYGKGQSQLLVEIVESSVRSGVLRPRDNGRTWAWDLPCLYSTSAEPLNGLRAGYEPPRNAMDTVIHNTLSSLSDALWEMAHVAATLDSPFRFVDFRQLTTKLDLDGVSVGSGMDPAVALNRLVSARVLRYEGESFYSFRVSALRQALLQRRVVVPESGSQQPRRGLSG